MRALLTILAVCSAATHAAAHLHFVNWEELPSGDALLPGSVITTQFNMWGALYSGDLLTIRGNTGPSISPPNTAVLTNAINPTLPAVVRIDFVFHGTTIPSICDFIAVTAIDSASEGTIFTLTAWDTEDGVIFASSTIVEPTGVYNPSEDQELVIFHPNIAYVTLSATAPSGGVVEVVLDNLRYNHIIPAPCTTLSLLISAWATPRRRRANKSWR